MKKTIAISLSPNVFSQDLLLTVKTILQPWVYNHSQPIQQIEKWFQHYFSVKYALSYSSGRAGLYEILQGYGIGAGDEVITQAFTCVALPNAIIATGAKPVYVDIAQNLTLDCTDLEKKLTKKTKAIIVQHTFGIPSDVKKIVTLGKKYNIPVIEDCAHGIGIDHEDKKLGQFGDVAFFSFGRDKAFSSVFGGMVITNDATLGEKLKDAYKTIPFPSFLWTAQQLFHPIAFSIILPLYDFFSLGKLLTVFFQKLHMLSFPVTVSEKKGRYALSDTKRLPGSLSILILAQLQRLSVFNQKREKLALAYIEAFKKDHMDFPSTTVLPYLRFPLLSEKRDAIILSLRKQHVYIGKWYANIIDPKGVDFEKIYYTSGSCPRAEWVAQRILNLPTYPRMSDNDVKRVIMLIKEYV